MSDTVKSGTTPAKATQAAQNVAWGSNKPTTGDAKTMLNRLPTNRPLDPKSF